MAALSPALAVLATVPLKPKPALAVREHLLDLLFPLRCGGCGRVGEVLCPTCRAQIQPMPQPVCLRCGRPVATPGRCNDCTDKSFHVAALRAAAIYAEPLSAAIHQFKYEGHPELHEPLGRLLSEYWRSRNVTMDLVLAVPLHPNRLRERGYNQSELLARVLCREAALPLLQANVLQRTRDTQQQMLLGPAERRANVQDAFTWNGPNLAGCKVLLVDDVATTGSTLEACATALLAAGAGKVWALTVARALGSSENSS
ncbi:MAG: ComF family protein [Anaerolineae bacterium]